MSLAAGVRTAAIALALACAPTGCCEKPTEPAQDPVSQAHATTARRAAVARTVEEYLWAIASGKARAACSRLLTPPPSCEKRIQAFGAGDRRAADAIRHARVKPESVQVREDSASVLSTAIDVGSGATISGGDLRLLFARGRWLIVPPVSSS